MALLDALRYDSSYGSTSASQLAEDMQNSEGKFGIPRFNGEAAALHEYAFRVRARMHREKHMEASELKKLGPLGLRLIEGLRGPALRLSQQLGPEELAKADGADKLISLFEKSFKPRRDQEARELYAAGSRDGGILSRQSGEPMSSYVLRRRTWWHTLQQLDSSVQVSESILAEQMLQNAQITEDQKLMIRTTLGGKMVIDAVAEELLNQHPRIHEREHHGRGRGYGSQQPHHGGKGGWRNRDRFHRGHRGHPHSYHAEEDGDGEWIDADNASQSLAGFTEDLDETGAYNAVYEDEVDAEMLLAEHVAWYIEEGLDFESEEACALAAEALQLEHEAYFVRSHAKGKGHGGFTGQRHFEVSGQLSMQEKKARLQQLKSRTDCRKCGQRGHWANDPQCPKSTGTMAKGGSKSKKGRLLPHERALLHPKANLERVLSAEWCTLQCMKRPRVSQRQVSWPMRSRKIFRDDFETMGFPMS